MAKKKNNDELQPYTEYLEHLSRNHDRSGVFNDFLTMIVCTLSMQQKEEEYLATIRKYTKEEVELFVKAFASLVLWMETHPLEDAFGDYFQQYISKGHNAQFFTPPAVTKMMAAMIGPGDKDGPVYDPCCGSGRFFLAAAQENRAISFVGGDITEACCKMTLVNACLHDIVGEVYHMVLRLPYIRELPVARQVSVQESDGASQAAG